MASGPLISLSPEISFLKALSWGSWSCLATNSVLRNLNRGVSVNPAGGDRKKDSLAAVAARTAALP